MDPNDILWPKANPSKREVLYERFKQAGISEANFRIEREDRGGRFFSEGAMEDLFDNMISLVGANLMRHYDETGKPPHTLEVGIDIKMEG